MIKAIIFDIDGTILDTEQVILKSLQSILKTELQKDYDLEYLRFVLGIPGEDALKQLNIPNVSVINQKWSQLMMDFSHEVNLFDGLKDIIEALSRQGFKLGIVTSKTNQELKDEFEPFGLNHYFEQIITACDTLRHKPHPDPLQTCLQKMKVSSHEAIYIGDSKYDMQCANSANVKFALALWGSRTTSGFESATYILKHPKDILELI